MLPPPLPGLHNVLSASSTVSYLSTTAHHLLPHLTRPPVIVHATHNQNIATAGEHVSLETPARSLRFPQRLHFRPLDIALRAEGASVTVIVAGADGALAACVDLRDSSNLPKLAALPGTAGYAIVSLAVCDDLIAAAAVDGRVAVWRSLHAPAERIFDAVPLHGDRVTDMKFVDAGLLVAWWSGRLLFYDFVSEGKVKWTMDAVCVAKNVFGAFPGCYIVTRGSVIALATGRADLVFVRLSDGGYCKGRVGEYVKGLCQHDGSLHLLVDGKLVTREWMSKEELDKKGAMTSVIRRKTSTGAEKRASNGDKQG